MGIRNRAHRFLSRRDLLWPPVVTAAFFGGGCSLSFDMGSVVDGSAPDGAGSNDGGALDAGQNDAGAETGTPGPRVPARPLHSTGAFPSPPTTNLVVDRPDNAQQGDFLIAAVYADNATNSITPPPGWTIIDTMSASPCASVAIWAFHIMGASEPSTYTFTLAEAPDRASAAMVAYRGVDASKPIGASNKVDVKGNAETYGPISVNADANDVIVMMVVNDHGGLTPNWTVPAGMTDRAGNGTTHFFDEVRANAGPSDPRTASTSADNHCGAVEMVTVRPAPR